MEEYEAAEASFGKAYDYSVSLHKDLKQPSTPEDTLREFSDDFCALLIHRAMNAWQLQQKARNANLNCPLIVHATATACTHQ